MDVLIVAIVLFVALIVFSLLGRSNKTAELDEDIKNLRERIIVVTSSNLPDRQIKGALGNVTGISETAASTDRGFRKAEKEALADIMRQGIQMGANAIIDLKMTTGSYEQQGSQWMVSKVVYYGTAVKV
jgi:uncharacterized protein YbjQ (UPF0145 family)